MKEHPLFHVPQRVQNWNALLIGLLLICCASSTLAQPVVTSSASFENRIAPASLATIFGTQFSGANFTATDIDPSAPGIQLPTQLGGVSLDVNGLTAGLLFVSPNQINFYVPPGATTGNATVFIRTNNGNQNAMVSLNATAPGIFTANGTGNGVMAGTALRVRNGNSTFESITEFNGSSFTTKPIDLGPASDQVYLVFFGTGWRNVGNAARILIGGALFEPQYAGPQGDFLGLDQINLLIPRALLGIGRIELAVVTAGEPPSNSAEAEIGGVSGNNAPVVSAVSPEITEAAQTISINGNGFSTTPGNNLVRIGGTDAQVISASSNQLTVRVPYGSESGKVLVRTANGDGLSANTVKVRTSLSGVVENTDRQPLTGVTIRSITSGLRVLSTTTGNNGAFVLSEFLDPQSGSALVVIDGSRTPTTPKFGTLTVNQTFLAGRDSQFPLPLTLQQITGVSAQVGGSGLLASANDEPITLTQPIYAQQQNGTMLQQGAVTFELPANTPVRFPDGSTSGTITLTQVDDARLPVKYPTPFWASAVVQITPFGTTFGRGGKMRFPNPEKYPANSRVLICQLEQGQDKPNIGNWTAPGNATVSSDGSFIETDPGTILQGSYYFVVDFRKLTTVIGRVFEGDRTPVRRALVRVRGQQTLTDASGGFIIRNVPVGDADSLFVEATFPRPGGRVDRANSATVRTNANGLTNVGVLSLPTQSLNQLPSVVIASAITAQIGRTTDIEFQAYDFEDMRAPKLSVSGAGFATIIAPAGNSSSATLRLTPNANQIGEYSLTISASDSTGSTTQQFVRVRVIR